MGTNDDDGAEDGDGTEGGGCGANGGGVGTNGDDGAADWGANGGGVGANGGGVGTNDGGGAEDCGAICVGGGTNDGPALGVAGSISSAGDGAGAFWAKTGGAYASSATASSSRTRPANFPLVMIAACLASERDQAFHRVSADCT